MTLVEKGTHPRWTGGFVTSPVCRCGHATYLHDMGTGCVVEQMIDEVHYRRCACRRWLDHDMLPDRTLPLEEKDA